MAYTKGEWQITDGIIWAKQGEPPKQTYLKPRVAEVYGTTPENLVANAHLIAAAPELYEALLSALGSLVALGIKDHSWRQEILDNIQQALAKAESK